MWRSLGCIKAQDFWGVHHQHAFFDVCVFNPLAASNCCYFSAASCFWSHDWEKCGTYEQHVHEIERASCSWFFCFGWHDWNYLQKISLTSCHKAKSEISLMLLSHSFAADYHFHYYHCHYVPPWQSLYCWSTPEGSDGLLPGYEWFSSVWLIRLIYLCLCVYNIQSFFIKKYIIYLDSRIFIVSIFDCEWFAVRNLLLVWGLLRLAPKPFIYLEIHLVSAAINELNFKNLWLHGLCLRV